jgi:DNA-binding beta-propeller fold protein YncE
MQHRKHQFPDCWRGALYAGGLAVLLVAGLAAFAFPQSAIASADGRNKPVWPAPPDAPRVAWVQNVYQPADLGAKVSGLRRTVNWITGAQKGNDRFARPFGIALDESANLCLTDTGLNTVSYYDRASRRWTRWERVGDLRFASPVAVAKKGSLICVADSALGAVIGFDVAGKLRFKATEPMRRPAGLAILGDRIFVADSQLHAVLVLDLNGRYQSQFGKRGVEPGEFNFPTHVATDQQGQLYITDSMNGRIQVFDASGVFRTQIGGAGDGPGFFSRPKGVAVDRFGHIYVLDAVFDNIQVFDGAGRLLLNLGRAGQAEGEFWLPNGLAIGSDNRIFVADTYNRRLQVLQYIGQP